MLGFSYLIIEANLELRICLIEGLYYKCSRVVIDIVVVVILLTLAISRVLVLLYRLVEVASSSINTY